MADDGLKIRIETENVSRSVLQDYIRDQKKLRDQVAINSAEFKTYSANVAAAQNILHESAQESLSDNGKMKESYFKLGEEIRGNYKQTIREARQEARMSRFVLLELMHGFDGVSTAIEGFAGATEHGKSSLGEFASSAKEGLNAGLGIKFALDLAGPAFEAFAGPVGIAVGAITFLGGEISAMNKDMQELSEKRLKELEEAFKNFDVSNLDDQLGFAQRKLEKLDAQAKAMLAGGFLGEGADKFIASKLYSGGGKIFQDQSDAKKEADELQKLKDSYLKTAEGAMKYAERRHTLAITSTDEYVKELEYAKQLEGVQKDRVKQSLLIAEIDEKIKKAREEDEKKSEKNLKDQNEALDKRTKLTIAHLEAMDKGVSQAKSALFPAQEKENKLMFDYLFLLEKLTPEELLQLSIQETRIKRAKDEAAAIARVHEVNVPKLPAGEKINNETVSKDIIDDYSSGINILQSGVASITQDLQGWAGNIVGATSALQQFTAGIIAAIAKTLEEQTAIAGIAGVLSLATGGAFTPLFQGLGGIKLAAGGVINEPVSGFGMKTGSRYLLGENGAERVTPLTNMAGSGGVQNIHLTGETRLDGRDIFISWKQYRVIDRKLGGNV